MTRNLKALGLALVAVFAMSALAAQGASAAVEHEFHADGKKTVVTGTNSIIVEKEEKTVTELSSHTFKIGESGTVTCNKVQTESTQVGEEVTPTTWKTDKITVTPHYEECTFGGNKATVDFEHCAYVFDSDTTPGNTTGGEHATVEIECAPENSIKITTSICTLIVPGGQIIPDAVRYENDKHNKNAVNVIATAHGVEVTHNGVGGCALVPKGKVGKYIGTTTGTCYRDDGETLAETTKTTPTGDTIEGPETQCTVSNL